MNDTIYRSTTNIKFDSKSKNWHVKVCRRTLKYAQRNNRKKKKKKKIKTLKKYFWAHCMHSYVIDKDKVLKSLKYMYKGDENK